MFRLCSGQLFYVRMALTMRSLYLVCCTLAAFVALSQGQISPCDFPDICFPPTPSIKEASDLQGQTLHARCYSACVEDVS